MLTLHVLPWALSVAQPAAGSAYAWATAGTFYTISHTPDELSIVCETRLVPDSVKQETGWRALMVEGVLDFSLTGILAKLSGTLAEAGISIFAISTYNTDYILLKEDTLEEACNTLHDTGYTINKSETCL